jgi:gentisate 1,2-dioxygenase
MSILDKETGHAAGLDDFYADLEANNMPALWLYMSQLITPKPVTDAIPYLWRWEEIYPRIMKAGEIPIERGGERRVLILTNPGLKEYKTATHNIYAGVQMVKPGEVAPAHRHTQSAIRFIIQGSGAYTSVEGERCFMEPYDLILTPPWMWHDHGNETDEPVIWMDGLDINFIRNINGSFFEMFPDHRQPVTKPDNLALKKYGGGNFTPAWQKPVTSKSSPLLIYKWARTCEALQELAAAGEASPFDDVALTYLHPHTGGSVLPTLSCTVQLIRPGVQTSSHRHNTSAVYHVVEGAGYSVIEGQRVDWKKGDFFVLPPWMWHKHANLSETSKAILFSVTDHPVFEAFGMYREESEF